MPVDAEKLSRYAHGIAREIAKAPKAGKGGRGHWIQVFLRMIRNELVSVDLESETHAS